MPEITSPSLGPPLPPFVHIILQGEPGTGKTTFSATAPQPLLVYSFDPWGKESPFLSLGTPSGPLSGPNGFFLQEVRGEEGQLLCRIEYYLDWDPSQPTAWDAFRVSLSRLQQAFFGRRALDEGEVLPKTVVFDSATLLEICCRKKAEYRINPQTKEPRQWFSYSTNQLEEVLMVQAGSLPCNVITCCHIDAQKDELSGRMLRNPMLPGRLRSSAQGAYGEMYVTRVVQGQGGERRYLLQTERDGEFNASSQIKAPNGVEQDFSLLFSNCSAPRLIAPSPLQRRVVSLE